MTKILFFIESLTGGGAEKVLRNLVNAMDQQRFQITVQTLYPEKAAELLAPGIRYRACYPAATPAGNARMRLEAALGLTYPLHIRGDYDIEVAYLECGSTKIMAGSTNRNALKLAWVHCDLAKKAEDPEAFARATAKYYRKFDKVICVSETARKHFQQLFPDGPECVTLYNTVPDESIRKDAEAFVPFYPQNTHNLVCAGRLAAEKGVDRLLAAHEKLLQVGIEQKLWIVGDGPERESLKEQAARLQSPEKVHFTGFQENPYPYMLHGDILVCPSHYEGFSTFVTEGLILGKPIVTTECSGMRELLGDSQYGLITANEDEAFYQGLRRMLTEPGLLEHYREMAGVRGKDFRQQTLVQATEAFLENTWKARWGK